MKKFIKIILAIWILFLLTVIAFIICLYGNIYPYSIYYAQNASINRKDDLVIMLLVDNLDHIKIPNNNQMSYDYDGARIINNKNFGRKHDVVSLMNGDGYAYFGKNGMIYSFDTKFELVHLSKEENGHISYEKIPLSKVNISDVKKEIMASMKPVIDVQEKPKTNMQWLFNIVYREKISSLRE